MSNEDILWSDDEWRAAMSTAEINDLPDDAFAYIAPGGEKDEEGKTTPRSLRHYPIHDVAHVRNALSRAGAALNGDDAEAKEIAEKALPAIKAAAKKFGIGEEKKSDRPKKPRHRSGPPVSLEVRHFSTEGKIELRDDGSNVLQLVGTPIVYNTPYLVRDMWGSFTETMKPGVVADLLSKGCDTRFLVNHGAGGSIPLARTTSGTLKLEDTPAGLRCTAMLDARQQLATDLAVAIERGDVSQMSCGFVVDPEGDEWVDNETRNIHKFRSLEDVSAVTYPASPTTSISVAQRMLFDAPVESRERVRRMWAITRDLRDGRPVDPSDIDILSDGLRALAAADEEIEEVRAEPTPQDKGIAAKIKAAHQAVTDAIHAQMGDADNATDPTDSEVMNHLHDSAKSLLKAIGTQAVDGTCDIPPQPPVGGEQGDKSMPQPDGQGVIDATGSRSAEAQPSETPKRTMTRELQRELLDLERRRLARRHRG